GRQLAAMHQITQSQFGWHRNNTIGSTPQINTREYNWCKFWRDYRLQHQLNLAQRQGYGGHLQQLGERLLAQMDVLFSSYNPPASLLHGDLWSGNYSGADDGTPVVFDPAVYYGDRETDLAMTELFGGFTAEFYSAYNEVYPLDSGYDSRKNLYNLYHVLNHVNLFGHSYIAQAENIMQSLLEDM
ncbi:Ribulosamine/erythrulosamine 3-kinase potentially involved in protein deglycation, partial [hydrothermal vent metagenome]